MPRSPTVFNLVPGTVPQVPDTPISSAMFNAAMLDFEQTFNTPQPIQYGGTAATTAIGGFDGLNTKGANVATAATLNLDTATGAFVDLTGTTTVTAVTLSDGRHRMARATGAFQITVGASLIGNAGGSNINVEVGDLIIFEGYSAGVVRFWVIRASGQSVTSTPLTNNSALTGMIVQTASASYTANTDITALIPVDDTIPQSNEGVQIMTTTITPRAATNLIRVSFVGQATLGAIGSVAVSLFKTGDADAIAATYAAVAAANYAVNMSLMAPEFVAGVTTPITIVARAGVTGGTARFNGTSTARVFAGRSAAVLRVEEIKA